jgi:hypothetical protein
MLYKNIIFIFISIFIINLNAFSATEVSIVDIKTNNNDNIIKYNNKVNKYYFKNCNKQLYKFDIILSNKKSVKKVLILKENEGEYINVLNKKILIFCLNNESKNNYNFINYKNEKGYIVIDRGTKTIIYDNMGNMIWFREYENYFPYFSSIDKNGILTSVLYRMEKYDTKIALLSNKLSRSHIIKFDIKKNSIIKTITPYEYIDGVKKFPPIDYHGFYEVKDGYYLISFIDSYVKTIPIEYKVRNSDYNKLREICDNSDKPTAIRKPRIIKINLVGEVVWSYNVDIKPFNNFISLSFNENQPEAYCEIDINHPNHISVSENEEIISIGMRNNSILLINKDKDIIGAFGYNIDSKSYYQPPEDNLRYFRYENDLYNGLCSTHSGFLNKKNQIIIFDNRCHSNESSRGVIYNLDYRKLTAKFVKSFLLSENINNCSKSNEGKINCNTKNMGASRFVDNGYILINWGEVENSTAVLSIFNNEYQKILEITGPKIGSQYSPLYISNYYQEKSFKTFIKALESISMGGVADSKRDIELLDKIKKSI